MTVIPAIDLHEGRVVRLLHGRKDSVEDYGDPMDVAQSYRDAELIHVVDIDGAFAQMPIQTNMITRLANKYPLQVGGGVRTLQDVATLIEAGAERVVVGTAAVNDPGMLERALEIFGPEKIVVAADVKDGRIVVSG